MRGAVDLPGMGLNLSRAAAAKATTALDGPRDLAKIFDASEHAK